MLCVSFWKDRWLLIWQSLCLFIFACRATIVLACAVAILMMTMTIHHDIMQNQPDRANAANQCCVCQPSTTDTIDPCQWPICLADQRNPQPIWRIDDDVINRVQRHPQWKMTKKATLFTDQETSCKIDVCEYRLI